MLTTGTSEERLVAPDAVAGAMHGVKAAAASDRRAPDSANLHCSARPWLHCVAAAVLLTRLLHALCTSLHRQKT